MFQFLRGIALIAAIVLSCGAAFGQVSANSIMPGCRFFATSTVPNNPLDAAATFRCGGLIEGILYGASVGGVLCVDPKMTMNQAIRVVAKYIDDRPQTQHEKFKALALEALRAAFPCKK
jgi:hypothetical protein